MGSVSFSEEAQYELDHLNEPYRKARGSYIWFSKETETSAGRIWIKMPD